MKNDVYLKTTQLFYEKGSELYFDFYNKDRRFLGNVIVTNTGKVSWYIIDLNYIDNIVELIDYIMGYPEKRRLQGESDYSNVDRWNNACLYIYEHSLVVNQKQFVENDELGPDKTKQYKY